MKEAKAEPLLINNLQEQLRLDSNAVWLSLKYRQENSVEYEKFITGDPVGLILIANEESDISKKYNPPILLKKLNLIVLNEALEETYSMIRSKGMPWLWGEFSKNMMVDHLRGIVEGSFKKHENDEFPDQISAELKLLDNLLKIGELRRSDYTGGNYKKYISEVKKHDRGEDQLPFIVQAATMFNPFLRIATDVFTTAQAKQENEQLTREYLVINRRAHHWISGIKKHAV